MPDAAPPPEAPAATAPPAAETAAVQTAPPPGSTLEAVEVLPLESPTEQPLSFFDPDAVLPALLVVVGTVLAVRGLQRLVGRLADRLVVHRLAIKQALTLAGFAAYGAAGLGAISMMFELSAQAFFAISGTLAIALGFLLKDVAESLVAGLTILIARPFSVGDRISFGGYYGEVRDIGLRTVQLVTLDDNLVTVPSNKFLSESVASANAGALDCMVVMTFWVATDADHERARDIVRDAVMSSRFCYVGKPITVLVGVKLAEQIGAVVEIVAKAYVFDARHEKSFGSDVTERVLRALRAEGIALPRGAIAA